jgi:hypothetical protein
MHYLFFTALYAFTSYALYRIAKRLSAQRPWFAVIPFAREWLIVELAGKSWKWFVALLIPVVNIVVAFIVWGQVARNVNRSAWLGRAMVIPLVNIVLLAALAFEFTWRDVWELSKKIFNTIRRKPAVSV